MCYIMCYNVAIGPSILVQRTQCRKGLIMYFKVNGIMAMKKSHLCLDMVPTILETILQIMSMYKFECMEAWSV
jgi:hypothetical protein